MDPNQAKQRIIDGITVTRQKTTFAKAFILKNFHPDSLHLINSVMDSVDAKMPENIVLHQSVDPNPNLVAALLIGAVPHIRLLLLLTNAAKVRQGNS